MNLNRNLNKLIISEIGGSHDASSPYLSSSHSRPAHHSAHSSLHLTQSKDSSESQSEDSQSEDSQSDLYSDLYSDFLPLSTKKHSSDFHQNRRKVRSIAEAKLLRLSEELSKLADEVRYHHPLIAEALDDAWDATEEALVMMTEDS